ncbi:hypothetical protein GCM10018962_32940 [Dactylosporangium matsuzakiense]|uniref:Uncharacterized protein n=1 Tax=Dactylosporangium matsuzakiense TaxID=53360 RepID=A0A9W6NMS3_9ACTN|nr:hypothetical protein GCM10017581_043030 [Dactylosporangium matsuzakiense]
MGRHSLGQPGLARRDWAGFMPERNGVEPEGRRPGRRPRHRRVRRPLAAPSDGWAFMVAAAVLGMLVVSGWYTAAGANAVAQMLAR